MFQNRLKNARSEYGISQKEIAKLLFISQQAYARYETGSATPSPDTLKNIASILGVTTDYLLGAEKVITKPTINAKDEKDIAKDLDSIMEKLTNKEDGPASFNGEDMSEETTALFKDELERALRILKVINKEKYNPNKNKSR